MSQTLFVRNLSWSVTEEMLFRHFNQVGQVLTVRIPIRKEDGKPRGFAFVEMASVEAAQQAVNQLHGSMVDGRDLDVSFQDPNRQSSGPNTARTTTKSAKLFVRNLDRSVTESDLYQLFGRVGGVVSVKIPIDQMTGQTKGFGFVEMTSADEAAHAIQALNQTLLGNREIAIDFQDLSRARPAPRPSHNAYRY